MRSMTLGEFLDWTPPLPAPGSPLVRELLESEEGQSAGGKPCYYYDCNQEAKFVIREDYVTGGLIFDTKEHAVCPQHVPQCAGGEDPHFLWKCGRPHFIKIVGEKEFRVIHREPWGFN